MSPLRIQLDRIRRRVWLVLALAILGVLGSLAASLGQQTAYTGRSTLTIISQQRAPEQDAPLAQGYAEYFNEKSYQQVLSKNARVPTGVTFSARTAATSPIVYIEATAPNPELATSAAAAMAQAFLADVNANLLADRESKIADLRNQITAERALLLTLPESSPEASLSANTVLSLQTRVNEIQADTSSELRELQLNAGVSVISPNPPQNAALGLVGGLLLGCVAALALASVENRLTTAHEVRDQLGLDTLALIPGGKSKAAERTRVQRFKRLANVLSLSDLSRPATVAVTSPRTSTGTTRVAEELAYYRAIQGERTLHMCADLHQQRTRWNHYSGQPGVADVLAGSFGQSGLEGTVLPGWCSTLQVMPAGSARNDPYALFGRERFAELVRRATAVADLVIIEAPAIIDAAESQVICATADRTILVIDEGVTHADDATEACQLLAQVEATLLGAVIIGAPAGHPRPAAEQPNIPVAHSSWPPAATASELPPTVALFQDGHPGVRQ